jgi:sulfatase maturation enzyme AslB (radical SAM superfamily)
MKNKKLKIYGIELTSRCNATCSYCPHNKMSRKKEDITNEIFNLTLKLIDRDNLWKKNSRYVVELHSFGEAFLLGDKLFYYLNRMKEERIGWYLSVNGILLGNTEFDSKILSYNGILAISIENLNPKITIDDKYVKINNFLKLHKQLNSNVEIQLIGYGNVDFSKIYYDNYIEMNYELHTWSENDLPISTCGFLIENFFIIQSNGDIVSCCMDAEGETNNFGTVFNPNFEHNKRWKNCETCNLGLM